MSFQSQSVPASGSPTAASSGIAPELCSDANRHPAIAVLRELIEQQQFATAKTQCLEILGTTRSSDCLAVLALAQAHLGETGEAERVLRELASERHQLTPDALSDLAAAYLLIGQGDTAETLLSDVLRHRPRHALALARLASCRLLKGDVQRALDLFEQSTSLHPRLPVLLNISRLLLDSDRSQQAQVKLDQARALLASLRKAAWPENLLDSFALQLDHLQLEAWVALGAYAEAETWLADDAGQRPDKAVGFAIDYAHLLAARDRHADAEEVLHRTLVQHPDNVALLSQSAELSRLQGHMSTAAKLLKRAIDKAPEDPMPWIHLSSVYGFTAPHKARDAAERALALCDEHHDAPCQAPWQAQQRTQARCALAQARSHAQAYEEAETIFRDILRTEPQHVTALLGLGQQQLQRGKIDEAIELFEQVQVLDPAKGHGALIGARRFPDSKDTLDELEKAARRPSLEGSVRAHLLFQLAAAWEKHGDYQKAFSLVDDANAASRKLLDYDPAAHRNQCARVRERFTAPLYEHRSGGVDSTLPVFVVGMPRSGTTLVEQIVAGHSRIFGAGELGLIPRTVQGLHRWERHVGSGRGYPDCVDDLSPEVIAGLANNLLEELREFAPQASHVVDKLPHNFEHIGLIKLLFPKARIISVRRDPRDIAISNYFADYYAKHAGMGFAYHLTHIGEQLADHNLLMRHWEKVFPGQILEINYEDVVDDLEGSARKLLDYIGVEWEPQVLAFDGLDRPVKTASMWQVRQPIYTTSKAKWKRYQAHLAPLIAGTNAPIRPGPVDMLTLPEPGFLTDGIAAYRAGDLDAAELSFKKMLHHNPDHAACTFMTGLIYVRKHHLADGIELMEQAVARMPWKTDWRQDLIQACELAGDRDRASRWQARQTPRSGAAEREPSEA